MKNRIFLNDSLRNAFREAYFSRERQSHGKQWQQQIMAQIREMGPLLPAPDFWPSFENLAWRLAPVNMVLILIFLLLNAGLGPDVDYLSFLATDLERPTLSEFFGVEGSG
jgi:hypothetical protein